VKRRTLTVMLAVLLAVLGTGAVLVYVHQANTRALEGQRAVTALVAQGLVPAGTTASAAVHEGLLTSQTMPASSVPADAVHFITPAMSSLVVSADVQPGQLLLRPMLVTAVQTTGALSIPSGMLAVSIQVCLPEAVAGYVHLGSQVAVFDTYLPHGTGTLSDSAGCQGQHAQQTQNARTRMVLPKAQVLSVGSAAANAQQAATAAANANSGGVFSGGNSSNSNAANSGQAVPVLVTLAVTQANAERLILLTQTGLPYLALLTTSSQTRFDAVPVPLFQP
jgi:pilus assembly protein CpaB